MRNKTEHIECIRGGYIFRDYYNSLFDELGVDVYFFDKTGERRFLTQIKNFNVDYINGLNKESFMEFIRPYNLKELKTLLQKQKAQ